MLPTIYRPAQAAEKLGVSVPTINRLVRAGELQRIKISERASGILGLPEFIARRTQITQEG